MFTLFARSVSNGMKKNTRGPRFSGEKRTASEANIQDYLYIVTFYHCQTAIFVLMHFVFFINLL